MAGSPMTGGMRNQAFCNLLKVARSRRGVDKRHPDVISKSMKTLYISKGSMACTQARTWLALQQVNVDVVEVGKTPPTMEHLEFAATTLGGAKALLNRDGKVYQQLGLSGLLQHLGSKEILEMISAEGALLKTPLLVDSAEQIALIGFNEQIWTRDL